MALFNVGKVLLVGEDSNLKDIKVRVTFPLGTRIESVQASTEKQALALAMAKLGHELPIARVPLRSEIRP